MSRIFVTKGFDRFAHKQRIDDSALIDRIDKADTGIIDANLKGCLVKLRLAREGEGKSGGYRTIVAYVRGERAFFLYGFSKNEKDNLTTIETNALEAYGAILLKLDDASLQVAIEGQEIRELVRNEEK